MKAILVVNGWTRTVDIEPIRLDIGYINIAEPLPRCVFSGADVDAIDMKMNVYRFTYDGRDKFNVPIFKADI